MQAVKASTEPTIRLHEPVSSLLQIKGPEVWSISPDATVYEAIELMAAKGIGALVVLDAGRLDGVFSERDYARKVILRGKHSRETRVREIMSTPALFIRPEQSVDECMRMMTAYRVRHLPVRQGDKITGLVSMGDLVNWVILSHEQTIHQLENYITGAYPG